MRFSTKLNICMTYHASMNGELPNQGETNKDFRNVLMMTKHGTKKKNATPYSAL